LLAKTEGLSITSADADVRLETTRYLQALTRACRALGGNLLVFGSPMQRRIPVGHRREDAVEFAADTLQGVAPVLDECNVQLLLEPLSHEETDFVNSCEEAIALAQKIGHAKIGLHLDVKAMLSERLLVVDLIRKFGPSAGHIHANDANRRGPGFGDVDFRPILASLAAIQYSNWISVEVFDYSPDPETIARNCLQYLRQCEPNVN
jgi:sugar phosphate isomerase/epimerase